MTPFQHQTAAFHKAEPHAGFGLFMDMGTGKTKVAIDLAQHHLGRDVDRVIHLCPCTSIDAMREEWIKHGGGHVPLSIVGIESLSSSLRIFEEMQSKQTRRTLLIVDESDLVKNPKAIRTQRIQWLAEKSNRRLIMTGTPVTQSPGDLWSQFMIADPTGGITGHYKYKTFESEYLVMSQDPPRRIIGYKNIDKLAERVAPFIFQVRKEECLDLPPKIHEARTAPLTKIQRDAYDEAKRYYLNDERIFSEELRIFRLLTALQQIVAGRWNFEGDWINLVPGNQNPKLLELKRLLEPIQNRHSIVWAKYTQEIDDIITLPNTYRFDGLVPVADRVQTLRQWRERGGVLVANPATGGRSLTLNEALYHFYYSNSFKYSERIQSEDRSHRVGQAYSVTYTDIRSEAKIDQKIAASLQRKEGLSNEVRRHIADKTIEQWVRDI